MNKAVLADCGLFVLLAISGVVGFAVIGVVIGIGISYNYDVL